jgi:excisionase family DNA binding protein
MHASGKGKQRTGGDAKGSMLTMGEACRLLNVHSNTLRRWNTRGLIKAYRAGTGRQRRFRVEDLNGLLVEQASYGGAR